ncbi:RNA exonuclease 4 [Skeletonema marinoi]|uniref:RNA exonuclease 4 n=1 Tax=Skeletonema marinoi TaxID=267567 RepID=A0AAD8YKQ0_9STRA|nr:RNA exonuclease 4 [Skeletonema marinoi]
MQEVPDLEDSSKSSLRPRKLKELVKDRLGNDIQELGKAHDPVEDALSALRLYKTERLQWEQFVVQKVAAAKVQEPRPYALEIMPPAPIPYNQNHLGSPNNMNMPMNMNMGMHSPSHSPNRNRYQSRNFQPRNRAYSAQHHQQQNYGAERCIGATIKAGQTQILLEGRFPFAFGRQKYYGVHSIIKETKKILNT